MLARPRRGREAAPSCHLSRRSTAATATSLVSEILRFPVSLWLTNLEGVPVDVVVGGVHLIDGGDGAAASGELHMPASLHFASSKKMLRCDETHVASLCS